MTTTPSPTRWRILAILCLLALTALSLWPADELVRLGARMENDKLGHFVSYMVLAWLFVRGWPGWPLWLVWLLVFSVGFSIEIVQYHLPTRSFEWLDLLANGTGAAMGVFIALRPWRMVWQSD